MDADDRPLPFFGPNANPHSASCRSTRSDGKCGLDWTYAGGVHYVILQPDRKQAAVIVGHQREVHSSWAFTAGNWVFERKKGNSNLQPYHFGGRLINVSSITLLKMICGLYWACTSFCLIFKILDDL